MKEINIMLVGVGGQGTLLASRLLGNVFIKQGLDVKVSEVHGMSQRGGSVVTYVKAGEKVYSPTIERGNADIIIAFEQLEAARWLPFLKPDGVMIANTQKINPMPVIIGAATYPENIFEKFQEVNADVKSLDALTLAETAGSVKAVNVVLLGAMAKYSSLPFDVFVDAVKETVPAKFLELNQKALELGYNAI